MVVYYNSGMLGSMDAVKRKDPEGTGPRVWTLLSVVALALEDSSEAERCFRREAERHSGMNPNTLGA